MREQDDRDRLSDLAWVILRFPALQDHDAIAYHVDDIPLAASRFPLAVLLLTEEGHVGVMEPVMRRDGGCIVGCRRIGFPENAQLFGNFRVRQKISLHLGIVDAGLVPLLDRIGDDRDFLQSVTVGERANDLMPVRAIGLRWKNRGDNEEETKETLSHAIGSLSLTRIPRFSFR